MKIIHTGDIHLGSALQGLPKEKAALRGAELTDGFRRLCLYARENGVVSVLIAGDLFDGGKVAKSVYQEAFSAMAAAAPVCFFYVGGNHDESLAYTDELPKNLYLFSNTCDWKSYDMPENITITGIDGKYMDESALSRLALRTERYNIVLAHGALGEKGGISHLQNKAIDYLALGHIHIPMPKASPLDSRGKYRYCGCLEGRGFDEVGARGFFLLEIENGKLLSDRFLSLAKREICVRSVDISACQNYYDVERAAFAALENVREENLIKLVLKGRHRADLRKDISLLTARLSQRFFFVKTVDESRPFIDYAAFAKDLSERGEFVREVSRYELNESEREEILEIGFKALAGEDIDL